MGAKTAFRRQENPIRNADRIHLIQKVDMHLKVKVYQCSVS